jgi:hypothetical protein
LPGGSVGGRRSGEEREREGQIEVESEFGRHVGVQDS